MPLRLLNNEQLEACKASFGHNLIIASAGTGKTSTIVGRISYLLNSGIHPSEILLLTFTNKASLEMIARLERFFDKNITKQLLAGTFHSIAYRYLKEHTNITLKQPRELKILFKSIFNARQFDNSTPHYKAEYLYDLISLYLNSYNGDFKDFIESKNKEHKIHSNIYKDLFLEFIDIKRQYNYASYDDLLILYKEKVQIDEISFCEVLVDEYQDTNYLQNSIISAFNTKSLFCVGDYDQSIYAFNGSDISIIASFKDRYKNAKIYSLNKNYRSSRKIIDIANNVIINNPRIYPKNLEVLKDKIDSNVELFSFSNTKEQYSYIAKHISSSKTSLSDIAIIFRNNTSSDYIEANLREYGIGCKKKGGKSFFESKEIAVFIDILSLFFNKKDMMAFVNVISNGIGIGEVMAKDIYDCLILLGDGDLINGLLNPREDINPYQGKLRNTQLGLFDNLFIKEDSSRFNRYISINFASHPLLSHNKLNSKSAIFLDKFYNLFLYKKPSLDSLFLHVLNSEFFKEIKLLIAQNRIKNKFKSLDSSKIDEFIFMIDKKLSILYNLSKSYDNLANFLNSIKLNSAESSSGEGVNLLTIHASKGLEFEDVYIIDLMEGRFPNTKLIAKTGSLEEERRLFYVATTRAKTNIYFSFAYKDLNKNINYIPSIFLKEAGLV
ncbi:ATP-dependent helicase [Helicobacter sp. MIT 14-3879]|uniref:ATP-dependent helicase n=1 Tax=Helicobacter sp. MIT 14-3879 TaxID=2040649 RepID=UPI000E1F5CD5|nr:ATP-dependent helicase [Helicobacter sp. MIT 14-3879]RDU64760.1 ATP-dependent DNA helicase [Helicobacter sp. MIT 14-3879]